MKTCNANGNVPMSAAIRTRNISASDINVGMRSLEHLFIMLVMWRLNLAAGWAADWWDRRGEGLLDY